MWAKVYNLFALQLEACILHSFQVKIRVHRQEEEVTKNDRYRSIQSPKDLDQLLYYNIMHKLLTKRT